MRILLVGAGGVGTAFARIAARRPFAELIIADYDLGRAQHAAAASDRFSAVRLDARDEQAVADLLAAHAADTMFAEIDQIGVRDGANLVVEGYDFAPTFSIWTTIEECLNPPVIWEA